ncbi:MAG TPA: metallophosphoesterase family protein [Gaiellales bacterium]|nr:metallophosphoesterase family protein [Gaiellales bacterium]
MRLAIVSDVHGNFTALEAVIADIERRGVERVLHGGDLALGGCQAAEVVDRIRELGWPGVVGNTDELLWRPEELAAQLERAPRLANLLRVIFDRYAPATRAQLGDERLAWLRGLPDEQRPGGLVLLHAAPGNLWRAPMPDADDEELAATYSVCDAELVVYGHIHVPFVRPVGPFTVANAGSVGSPHDGDPAASYLIVEDGRAQVVRVEYDVEREAALVLASGYPGREAIAQSRRRGRYVPPAVAP